MPGRFCDNPNLVTANTVNSGTASNQNRTGVIRSPEILGNWKAQKQLSSRLEGSLDNPANVGDCHSSVTAVIGLTPSVPKGSFGDKQDRGLRHPSDELARWREAYDRQMSYGDLCAGGLDRWLFE